MVALLLIEAVALCGFMVNFIVVHRGAILGDMSYDDACGLASCCSLGFAASSVAMAVAGKKAMEMGVMRPDLLHAESMRAVKFGSSIGFYALVAGLLPGGTARGT